MAKVLSIQGAASALRHTTGVVSTELSGQPEIGDFLVATSQNTAEWSTIAVGTGNMIGAGTSSIGGLVEYTSTDALNTQYSGVLTSDLITEDTFLAKGDLVSSTALGVSSIVPIGLEDNMVLTVDSTTPSGMIWATPTTHNLTVRTVSTSGNVLLNDDIINMGNFGLVATMTLPDAFLGGVTGVTYTFIKQFADDVIIATFNVGDKIVNSGVEVDTITLSGAVHERISLLNNGAGYWFVM